MGTNSAIQALLRDAMRLGSIIPLLGVLAALSPSWAGTTTLHCLLQGQKEPEYVTAELDIPGKMVMAFTRSDGLRLISAPVSFVETDRTFTWHDNYSYTDILDRKTLELLRKGEAMGIRLQFGYACKIVSNQL